VHGAPVFKLSGARFGIDATSTVKPLFSGNSFAQFMHPFHLYAELCSASHFSAPTALIR